MTQPLQNSNPASPPRASRGKLNSRLGAKTPPAAGAVDSSKTRRRPSREKHPWASIHAFYTAPRATQDGAQVNFPTYEEASEKFGVPADQIRARGAQEKWVDGQKLAQDRWWTDRNNAMYRVIAQRLPQAQMGAFANALRGLELIRSDLNAAPDSNTKAKLLAANKTALETCFSASAMDSRRGIGLPAIHPYVDSPCRLVVAQEETTITPTSGDRSQVTQRRTLLEIFQDGRSLALQLLVDNPSGSNSMLDDLDRPSPLPTHLSMVPK